MVRRLVCFLTLTLLATTQSAGAAEQFPYQAIVVGEQVDTRCGPGAQFYVTGAMKQNDQVTVHRHDHGGWYMISPPPGSFSWIDASLVNPIGSNRGTVTISPGSGQPNRAIVYIGSQFSDDHSFYGRELSNGDEVTILGEKTLPGPNGNLRMFKIVPPAQEFRWVKGEFLVPMSRQIQQQLAVDPYQIPAEFRQRQAMITPVEQPAPTVTADAAEPRLLERKRESASVPVERKTSALMAPAADEAPVLAAPTPAPRNHQDYARLQEIDQNYAKMIARDPAEWDLEPICQAYEDLQKSGNAHVAQLVGERMEQVSRRRDIARHYQKFVQVSSETSRRDAQLLAQRAEFQVEKLEAPEAFQSGMEGVMQASEEVVPDLESSHSMAALQQTSPPALMPAAANGPTARSNADGVAPQLNGAGILHRMQAPPGFPSYVLVAPDGRMLAYVEPGDGVSLEPWVGKPTGLIGRRTREENYNADLIRAHKVVPVQLSR